MYLHFDINQIEVETMHVVFNGISARQKIINGNDIKSKRNNKWFKSKPKRH